MKLTDSTINKTYNTIKSYHGKFLKDVGVKLPNLKYKTGYTKDALVLIYLAQNYPQTKVASKNELTQFIRQYYPNTNDMQQARHLGAQKGWWIVAGGRDNIVENLKRGEYKLYTLEQPYPDFKSNRRLEDIGDDFDEIKRKYQNRCATCGSVENKPHFHWPATKTKLQKAHMNPQKPLIAGNIIPQCQKCNQADRNRWEYDRKGRVIKLANAKVILRSTIEVQKKAYKLLEQKFNVKK
ncbi:MAG: hypothetical protein DRQ51_01635 [Gammaproteobacteria bacterium]|nr:MAG: hypothetical protein DRQ51_01635 [Gammaproteobacteria bacterium]